MRKTVLSALLALSALGFATGAAAERFFPPNAQRGEMKAFAYPQMKIGEKILRLSAGSRIYNEKNLIIMPASLQRQNAHVIYAVDINGQLSAVWLLTPEEIKKYPLKVQTKPVPKTVTDNGRKN